MKLKDRLEVLRDISDSRWDTIKKGMKGTIIHIYKDGDSYDITVEFDDDVKGQALCGGKDGHCWKFAGKEGLSYFKVIEKEEDAKEKENLLKVGMQFSQFISDMLNMYSIEDILRLNGRVFSECNWHKYVAINLHVEIKPLIKKENK